MSEVAKIIKLLKSTQFQELGLEFYDRLDSKRKEQVGCAMTAWIGRLSWEESESIDWGFLWGISGEKIKEIYDKQNERDSYTFSEMAALGALFPLAVQLSHHARGRKLYYGGSDDVLYGHCAFIAGSLPIRPSELFKIYRANPGKYGISARPELKFGRKKLKA